MANISYVLDIEGAKSLDYLKNLDKNIVNIDTHLLTLGKTMDKTFDGKIKSASINKDIESVLTSLKKLQQEYSRVEAMKPSDARTTQLNNIRSQYELTTVALDKYSSGLATYIEMQSRTAAPKGFKQHIQDLTSTSSAIKDLNKYYSDLEKQQSQAANAENKIAKKETTQRIKLLNAALQKSKDLTSQLKKQSTGDLLNFKPKNINEANAAIQELTTRRNNLNRADQNYLKTLGQLNTKQAKLIAQNQKAAAQGIAQQRVIKDTTTAFSKQSRTVSELRNQMIGIFSIYGAERFLKKLVQVRGEFELQSVALTAMLQDRKLADSLFAEVQALALQSPFKILELNKYLKQLKAYRIENEDLIGTLKQLGDISAGVGVSMDRLILAYGQVRAASVLRGTELRQFTEAGIPLVAQLADKFTELEGVVVGTDEVFERISNRQVSFEMVRDIFGDMTREGGIFFDQQRKQAGTLSGQVSILADAYDKMLNNLGKANEGSLKGAIGVARDLVDNYELVLDILGALVVNYGVYNAALIINNALQKKQGNILEKVARAQKALNTFVSKNPYVAAAIAITAIITALGVFYRQQKRVNDSFSLYNKLSRDTEAATKKQTIQAKLLVAQLKETEKGSERRNELIAEANNEYPSLLSNINAEIASTNELNGAYSDFAKTVEQGIRIDIITDSIKNQISEIRDLTKTLNEEQEKLKEGENAGAINFKAAGGFFGQIFSKNKQSNQEDDIKASEDKLLLLEDELIYQKELIEKGKQYADISRRLRDVGNDIVFTKETESLIEFKVANYAKTATDKAQLRLDYQTVLNELLAEQAKLQGQLNALDTKELDASKWKEDVEEIVKLSEFAGAKSLSALKPNTRYQAYVESLRKGWSGVKSSLDNVNIVKAKAEDRKDLIKQYNQLKLNKKLYEDIARALGIGLDTSKGGGGAWKLGGFDKSAIDQLKNDLKLLKELRAARVSLDKAADEKIDLGIEKVDYENIFDKGEFQAAFGRLGLDSAMFNSLSDEDFQKVLDKFLANFNKRAEDIKTNGTKAGKNYIDGIKEGMAQDIGSLSTENPFDKLVGTFEDAVDNINLREKLIGAFPGFGEGSTFEISLITQKAEEDLSKITDDYKKASQLIYDNEGVLLNELSAKKRKALNENYEREKESILKIRDESIKSEVEKDLKNNLGNFDQFYSSVSDATLSGLIKVNKIVKTMSKRDPITFLSPEQKELLSEAEYSLEEMLAAAEANSDISFLQGFGISKEQAEVLVNAARASRTYNGELGKLKKTWKEIFTNETIGKVGDAAALAGDSISTMGSSITELGSVMEDAKLEEFGKQLTFVGEAVTKIGGGAKAFAAGSWGGLLAQGVTDTVEMAAKLIQSGAEMEAARKQIVLEMATNTSIARREYNIWAADIIRNTKYVIDEFGNLQETTSVFDIANPFSVAISGAEAYRALLQDISVGYSDEFNTLEESLNSVGKVRVGSHTEGVLWLKTQKNDYGSLADEIGESSIDIFSEEQLQKALGMYDELDEATKLLVDDWKAYYEAAQEALSGVGDSIEALAGSAVGDFSDALVDGFMNGADAADAMKTSVEGIVEAMLQQMLTATLLAPAFSSLEQDMYKSMGLKKNADGTFTDTGGGDQDFSDDMGRFYDNFDMDAILGDSNDLLQKWQDDFKELYGLDIFTGDDGATSGLTQGIQSITEDTANIIAAYLNTIRNEVILHTGQLNVLVDIARQTQSISSQQLAELTAIRINTARVASVLEEAQSGSRPLYVA